MRWALDAFGDEVRDVVIEELSALERELEAATEVPASTHLESASTHPDLALVPCEARDAGAWTRSERTGRGLEEE